MFKNLKLGTKIILGFLTVVILVAVAGVTGYWGVEKVGAALHTVANEEAPIVDAGSEMRLAVEQGKRLAEELKSATAALATDDVSQIDGMVEAFNATTETFDAFADAILQGGEIDGDEYIKTDNEELASLVRETDELHNNKFQPAFTALKDAGLKLLEAKATADDAMEQMEEVSDAVLAAADSAESAVGVEIDELMASAESLEDAKKVLAEEVPLIDCTMEIKVAILNSRICLEEIAQATSSADIDEAFRRYNQTIEDADAVIMAVLNGGDIDGNKITATDNDAIRNTIEDLDKKHTDFQTAADAMISAQRDMIARATAANVAMEELDSTGEEMEKLLVRVEDLTDAEMAAAKEAGQAAKTTATWSLIVIVVSSVILGLGIGIFLTRSITTVLNRIVAGLTEGAEQVGSASGQVSSASQSLAEGATEQAAGLEETSSSLEEMASMTKQNADNAQQASTLASEARKAADTGAESMGKMNTAIQEIQKSSDETAKIIKVIDEIAFQTNLLALNAAVEAARAGEAGKGFAVVAEEVRNLAMRSAEAAKNTSEMIEDSVKNAKNGVDIANEVGKVLNEIVEGIGKTSDLVGEIAAASQEQAQGIDQVNTAVNQMDKVTQQNAANAEESASASEELSAQAEQMKSIVGELVTLVSGSSGRRETASVRSKPGTRTGSIESRLKHSDQAFHQIAAKSDGDTVAAVSSAKTTAEKAIPLDDNDDFKGFNS